VGYELDDTTHGDAVSQAAVPLVFPSGITTEVAWSFGS